MLESLAQPVRGTLAAQSGVVTAVAYSPGSKTLAAGYQDGTIRLWDVASHRLISTASWGGAARALAFTGGGKTLEVAGPAAVGVQLWHPGRRRRERDHRAVESGRLSPVLRSDRHRHAGFTRGHWRPSVGRAQPR